MAGLLLPTLSLRADDADQHYQTGRQRLQEKTWDAAAKEFEQALKLNPGHEQARLALALLLLQQSGAPDRAIALYKEALKQNPKSAEAHQWLGVAYMQKNALSDAAAELRKAIALKPDFIRAYNNLGSTLAQSGDLNQAIAIFESGLERAPDDWPLHLNLGLALGRRGDAEAAIAQFRIVLDRDPENAEVRYQLGQTLRQKGDLEGAVQAFESVLGANPEMREAYYGLGLALKQQAAGGRHAPKATASETGQGAEALARGDLAAARELLEKAIQLNPNDAQAYNFLGYLLGRSGDAAGALEKLDKAVALQPDLAAAHYNRGAALWYSGQKSKSKAELDEAVRLDAASVEAYAFLGMACRESGDYEKARKALQRAIGLNPRLPAPYIDLGLVFLKTGQLAWALGQFDAAMNLPGNGPLPDIELVVAEMERVLAENSGNAEAHNTLGRLLGLAGADSSKVIAEFREAIRLKPDYVEAQNNLGLVYMQTGDDENAIASFRAAIRQRPEYADAHGNLGAVLTATDVDESVKELEKALQLEPALLKAQYNLALAYGASPKHGPDKEIALLRKVIETEPAFSKAQLALGKSLLRKGSVAEAISHLEQTVKLDPNAGEAHYQLGLALSRAGRQQEGGVEIEKGRTLIAADQREQALGLDMAEGKAALAKGEVDEALGKFEHVVKLRPESPEARYQLGLTLLAKKDESGAQEAFRKALELEPTHSGAKQSLDKIAGQRTAMFEDYIRDKRYAEVEPMLSSYVKDHPDSWWGWYALGYTQFAQQKVGDSIRCLAKSLQLNIRNPEAHKVLGRGLMMIGRFDAAQLEFEQAIRLSPGSAELHYNLGKLFSIQDNWAPARKELETAIKLDASYAEAHDALGFALEALGDDPGAAASYLQAIRLNTERHGTFAAPWVNLSALHNREARAEEALECARKALEINPKSDRALFQMAKAYDLKGDPNAAVDSLARAIGLNSHVSSYYYVLGTVMRRLGRSKDSQEAFESFRKLEKESTDFDRKRRELASEDAVRFSAPGPGGPR